MPFAVISLRHCEDIYTNEALSPRDVIRFINIAHDVMIIDIAADC